MTGSEWVQIITAIFAGLASLLGGIAAVLASRATKVSEKNTEKIEELKVNTDGKHNELMIAVAGQKLAEGKLEGQQQEKSDQAARDAAPGPLAGAALSPSGSVMVEIGQGPGTSEAEPLHTEVKKPKPKK